LTPRGLHRYSDESLCLPGTPRLAATASFPRILRDQKAYDRAHV
jgi:hypothetical protein